MCLFHLSCVTLCHPSSITCIRCPASCIVRRAFLVRSRSGPRSRQAPVPRPWPRCLSRFSSSERNSSKRRRMGDGGHRNAICLLCRGSLSGACLPGVFMLKLLCSHTCRKSCLSLNHHHHPSVFLATYRYHPHRSQPVASLLLLPYDCVHVATDQDDPPPHWMPRLRR